MLKDDVDMAPHFGKFLQLSVGWGRVSFPHHHPHPPTNVSPSSLPEEEKKRREGPSLPYRRL